MGKPAISGKFWKNHELKSFLHFFGGDVLFPMEGKRDFDECGCLWWDEG